MRICDNLCKYGYCNITECKNPHPSYPVSLDDIERDPKQYITNLCNTCVKQASYKSVLYSILKSFPEYKEYIDIRLFIYKNINFKSEHDIESNAYLASLESNLLDDFIRTLLAARCYREANNIVKKFKLDRSHFPGLVNYLQSQKTNFIIRGLSNEIRIDVLVKYLSSCSRSEQYKLINKVCTIFGSSSDAAIELARTFSVHLESFPNTKERLEQQKLYKQVNTPLVNAYQLPKGVPIIFVDSIELFLDAVQEMSQQSFLGYDSEWCLLSETDKPAIIQIASIKKVWILDMLSLYKPENYTILNDAYSAVVSNHVTQIWLGSKTDLGNIRKNYINFNSIYNSSNCIDLDMYLADKYLPDFKQISLTNLAYIFTGFHLDKLERMSNWEKRPLRESQLYYAAIDSYIEVVIYDICKQYSTWEEMDNSICERFNSFLTDKTNRMNMNLAKQSENSQKSKHKEVNNNKHIRFNETTQNNTINYRNENLNLSSEQMQ